MFTHQLKQEDIDLGLIIHFPPGHQLSQPEVNAESIIKKNNTRGRPKGEKNSLKKKQSVLKHEKTSQNKKTGHWSSEENRKYHWFLQIYNHHFLNKHLRRTDKIFKTMQLFLGTREAQQCRSHHQKMQKKHKTFQQILIHLRNQYYGTSDHNIIAEDLRNNNIQLIDSLVSNQQLRRQNQNQIKVQEAYDNEAYNLHLQEESKAIENMFSDRYENNMDFKNFL